MDRYAEKTDHDSKQKKDRRDDKQVQPKSFGEDWEI